MAARRYKATVCRDKLEEYSVWSVVVKEGEFEGQKFLVTDTDAWNFDIDKDLPVEIRLARVKPKGYCAITKRLKNNKKYIKI
jgi:hypothetical protein